MQHQKRTNKNFIQKAVCKMVRQVKQSLVKHVK